jgi:hypothetical protein
MIAPDKPGRRTDTVALGGGLSDGVVPETTQS